MVKILKEKMTLKCKGIFGLRAELDKYLTEGKIVKVISTKNSWYTIEVEGKNNTP